MTRLCGLFWQLELCLFWPLAGVAPSSGGCCMAKLIFLISMATAHAGWWSDWCERHLIADDPEQYADAPTSWLEHRIYYIEVMVRANMATKTDIRILKSLKKEMERRTHG